MNHTARLSIATLLLASWGAPFAAEPAPAWDVRDSAHPVLGNVRTAVLRAPVETVIGGAKIYTRATLSCQKSSKKIAIELENGTSPDAQNVLKPNKDPRIVCNRSGASQEMKAEWDVRETGVPITRELPAAALRQCASLSMVQEVALPQGWAQKSSKLELQIAPASKELDSVFVACGGPAAPAVVAAAPAAATQVALKTEVAWQTAHVITGSKTNVRGAPNTAATIVAQLEPGVAVLVQKTGTEWWRAKPEKAPGFEGYIRNDRLVFK